jgi:2-keto-3-deoxy-L-rhamnonate aldolase RhmA
MYLKERLTSGECVIGAGIYSGSVEMIEYTTEGMDWIWLEAQHTHPDWQSLVYGVRTAYTRRIPTLVRTWTHDPGTIEKLLDTGAEGIIVPMVNTPGQAEQIVSHCYYPPVGIRSYGSLRTEIIEKDTAEWNKRIMTIMMIETPEAIENAEAIANVDGVDGLLMGASDLSLRRGRFTGSKTAHDMIAKDVEYLAQVCKSTGTAAATIALTGQALIERMQQGYQLICAGMDLDHVRDQNKMMQDVFKKGKELLGSTCV